MAESLTSDVPFFINDKRLCKQEGDVNGCTNGSPGKQHDLWITESTSKHNLLSATEVWLAGAATTRSPISLADKACSKTLKLQILAAIDDDVAI